MKAPRLPQNEQERIATLRALHILDSPSETRFDSITRITQKYFNVPMALVSLVDEKRQWFKSRIGVEAKETPRDISFCGHAILDPKPFIINDARLDDRFYDNPLVTGEPHIRFYAGMPIKAYNGHTLGTLCIMDTEPRTLSDDELTIFVDLAHLIENELSAVIHSNTDFLTGILNRRGFELVADNRLKLCAREQTQASLVFIDLDKFKLINDNFGHKQGDRVLTAFAEQLKHTFRDSDIIARLGGDEFVVLVSNMSTAAVCKLADRLENAILSLNKSNMFEFEILFSYGVIEYQSHEHFSIRTLLEDGDKLMYQAKHSKTLDEQDSDDLHNDFCI